MTDQQESEWPLALASGFINLPLKRKAIQNDSYQLMKLIKLSILRNIC